MWLLLWLSVTIFFWCQNEKIYIINWVILVGDYCDYFLINIYIVYKNKSTERRVFIALPYFRNQYSKMIFFPPKVVTLSP